MKRAVFCVLTLLAMCAPVMAQPVVQASSLATFTASPDHAVVVGTASIVTGYRLDIVKQGATVTALSKDLGKPTPDASNTITTPVWTAAEFAALPSGIYTATVSTLGPGGITVSAVSDPFAVVTAPRAAGKPKLP